MRTVYRFPIPLEGGIMLALPVGARILHFAQQTRAPHQLCVWAVLDPEREPIARHFAISGTGTPVPDFPMDHVGTCQTREGYVWHLWEVMRGPEDQG